MFRSKEVARKLRLRLTGKEHDTNDGLRVVNYSDVWKLPTPTNGVYVTEAFGYDEPSDSSIKGWHVGRHDAEGSVSEGEVFLDRVQANAYADRLKQGGHEHER